MKKHPTYDRANGLYIAAKLLKRSIDFYEAHPDQRNELGINLYDLADVARVRRKLLKQAKQSTKVTS